MARPFFSASFMKKRISTLEAEKLFRSSCHIFSQLRYCNIWWSEPHVYRVQAVNHTAWPAIHGRVFLVPRKKSVRYSLCLHWTSHFLQGTRNTRPCISGHPVWKPNQSIYTLIRSRGWVQQAAPALANPPKYHRAIRFSSGILKQLSC